jgi:hypothetical protein
MPFFTSVSFRRKKISDPLISHGNENSNITVTTEISRTITSAPAPEPLHFPSPATPPPRLIPRAATIPFDKPNETLISHTPTANGPSLLRRTLSTSSRGLGPGIKRAMSSSSRPRSNSLSVKNLRRTNSYYDKLHDVKEEGTSAGEHDIADYDEELETWKCCHNDEDEVVGGDPRPVGTPANGQKQRC